MASDLPFDLAMPVFGRKATLQVGVPGSGGYRWSSSRLAFKVKHTGDAKANEADIQIWNLSPDTISLLQDRAQTIWLFAGYETDVERLIFTGNPIKDGVNIERNGPDRILRIQAQDGGRNFGSTNINISFGTSTRLAEVLEYLGQTMSVPIGVSTGLENLEFPQGISLQGNPKSVMTRLGEIAGATITLQDGALQVIRAEGDAGLVPAVLLSTETGNLKKVARKEKGRIEAESVLNGAMRPGARLKIQSEWINGVFRAIDVEFVGDTHDGDFSTKITARPYPSSEPEQT